MAVIYMWKVTATADGSSENVPRDGNIVRGQSFHAIKTWASSVPPNENFDPRL